MKPALIQIGVRREKEESLRLAEEYIRKAKEAGADVAMLPEISAFRTYVKTEYNDFIERKIRRITGITEEMVQNAPVFNEAIRMFTNWCLGTGDDVTIYAWSDTDFCQIAKEITLKKYEMTQEEENILITKWSDFQKEFDTHLGFDRKVSLSMALDMAGIDFTRHHLNHNINWV